MACTTTICIEPSTKNLLDGLKIHGDETYNSVVKRLASNAYDDDPLTEEDISDIEEALQEIRDGKAIPEKEAWKLMGLDEE